MTPTRPPAGALPANELSRRSALKGALACATAAALPRSAAWAGDPGAAPVAHTKAGQVRGYTDNGVCVFKGVRYGADTGPNRFAAPRPPEPWPGVRDALEYGRACPQSNPGEAVSEDCLFLNVWTPGLQDAAIADRGVRDRGLRDRGFNAHAAGSGARRPVMVYIHGGAYSHGSGSSPLYDGVNLSRRGDVAVVTLNHRLGALGYLYLARIGAADAGLADSGNAGMLDMALALKWVRENIEAFGGDPGNVTVFGQSGGGAKIATLMAMPAASGLFHRAATMSGQQLTASGPLNATARARAYLDALKLKPERVDSLRSLPVGALIAAMEVADPLIARSSLYFGPVFDDRALQRHPFYPDAPPLSAKIPMIIGGTHDETRTLIGSGDPTAFTLTWEQLPTRLASEMRVDISPESVIAEYRKVYPNYSASDLFFAATTASRSWRAGIVEAELRAQQGSPVYAYQLDWKSPKDGGKWGAPHTLDIPLVFDNIGKPGSITGTAESARQMANQMSEAFIAFARSGNPNSAAIPAWTPYTLPRRETLVFDVPSHSADDPRGAERRLFASVPYIQPGT